MTRRLLVTGSRDWDDRALLTARLGEARAHLGEDTVLVHGDCRGADRMAAEVWTSWGLRVEAHPADWDRHGNRAGPIRNSVMVGAGADLCLAFLRGDSTGTRDCMRRAYRAGITVWCERGTPALFGEYAPGPDAWRPVAEPGAEGL